MGKITGNKKIYRVDPLGTSSEDNNNNNNIDEEIPINANIEDDETGTILYNQVISQSINVGDDPQRLLTMIDDQNVNQRDIAFRMLCELIADDTGNFNTKTLMQPDNLTKVIRRVVDPEPQVAALAMGALRNLTITTEASVEMLLSLDVLTPLLANFDKSLALLISIPGNKYRAKEGLLGQHILLQSLALLTNLCELSDKAFELITKAMNNFSKLFNILIAHGEFLPELVFFVGEFLSIITEDNPTLCLTVGNELLMQLFQCVSGQSTMSIKLKSLISITLLNIGSHYNRVKVSETITPVLLTAFQFQPLPALMIIQQRLKQMADAAISQEQEEDAAAAAAGNDMTMEDDVKAASIPAPKEEEGGDNEDEDDEMEKEINVEEVKKNNAAQAELLKIEKETEQMIEQWKDSLSAQQSAIEIFTNIFSSDDDANAAGQSTTDSPYDEDDKFLDIEDIQSDTKEQEISPLIKYLETTTLLTNLMDFIESVESHDLTAIARQATEMMSLIITLKTVYSRAITCLSNLLLSFTPSSIHSQPKLWQLLLKIASHLIRQGVISQAKTEVSRPDPILINHQHIT
ncbi:hypothetical protein SAMD00019534_120420 [Acytostelium subglobosum LB1]|uniref:hypothetical protein n=1 Tax=Acytostelium subglobosum LB1 TaxID=1410327 RepID=UPI000644AEBD|nr:hypothetical protein SAMD00019534_120420 [Acytostelium subglobosum LB1]GAM28866.1 hypothetical protein SAMD00019534_120420 [Acytostelium subglobosum LB1]|eukprot:XP_012748238.1 hypothetical protein SAMD00019534_120420 [Acytostelium subglobosum LB1]